MDTKIEIPNLTGIKASWQKMVAPYQHSDLRLSLGQLANTLLPYLGLWILMIFSLRVSYWLTLALIIPAAAFLVRLFIIFHDLGHGSFFKSKAANRWVGFFLGVLVFTPSETWWHDHAIHHATSGNLDKRGTGDVATLTVDEYIRSSWWRRFAYSIFRHPLGMFLFGPLIVFLVTHRFDSPNGGKREHLNVITANLALLAIFLVMSLLIGWKAYLLIQIPIVWLGGAAGIWLFYIQHQFEDTYWVRSGDWDYTHAALEGASYYKLPKVLQWFSGNIGFHHIHHLSPRIPNYFLEKCYRENAPLQDVPTFNLITSLKSLNLRLVHEQIHKMVDFRIL